MRPSSEIVSDAPSMMRGRCFVSRLALRALQNVVVEIRKVLPLTYYCDFSMFDAKEASYFIKNYVMVLRVTASQISSIFRRSEAMMSYCHLYIPSNSSCVRPKLKRLFQEEIVQL